MANPAATIRSGDGAITCEPINLCFSAFRLDTLREQLWRNTELVALKPRAFAILRYLVDHPERLITKDELLSNLWGGVHVNAAVLKTHLRDIRIALGDQVKCPRYIETATRRGYRFIAPVRREPTSVLPNTALPNTALPNTALPNTALPNTALPALEGVPYFVGRDAELAQLRAAWAEANLGRRQLVFISGPPGIGKTSLVRAFLSPFTAGCAVVAWGQCVAQPGAGEAYLAVLEALCRLSRGPHGPALRAVVQSRAPSWSARLPVFDEQEDTALEPAAPAALADSVMRELADALEAFTHEQPFILLVEDAHCADPSTVTWLAYWSRRADFARMLIVCTYHHPEPEDVPGSLPTLRRELQRLPHYSELQLGELSRPDVERYLRARFTGARIPAALMAVLNDRIGGSPLFLTRAVDTWVSEGLLTHEAETSELTVDVDGITSCTPQSVVSLIEREYEVLDDFERRVIDAASVAGKTFSVASVAGALSEDVVRVEALCLDWARRGQFLLRLGEERWPDGTIATRFEFIHALYQEVGYHDVGAARQARLHLRMAETLEAAHCADLHAIASVLALHFECGQDFERAVHFSNVAGEKSYREGAYREAAAHFRRGIRLLQQLQQVPTRDATEPRLRDASTPTLDLF